MLISNNQEDIEISNEQIDLVLSILKSSAENEIDAQRKADVLAIISNIRKVRFADDIQFIRGRTCRRGDVRLKRVINESRGREAIITYVNTYKFIVEFMYADDVEVDSNFTKDRVCTGKSAYLDAIACATEFTKQQEI